MVGSWNAQAGVHSNWIESFARVQDLVDLCNQRKADLLVVAGDSFHTGRPSAEAVHRYINILSGLRKQCKVMFTDGNHDQTGVIGNHRTPLGAYLADQSFTLRTMSNTEVIEHDGVSIAAIPWHRVAGQNSLESTASALSDDVKRMSDIIAHTGGPSFLFGHFTVDEVSFGSEARSSELLMSTSALEATLSVSELENGPWSFWRAGHIHRHMALGDKGGYTGSTYKVSFAEQDESKGAEVIELNDDGTYSHEFVAFEVRELSSITLLEGASLLPSVANKQKSMDILRLMLPAEQELDAKSERLVKDMLRRGVEVQIRHLPKERKQIRNVQVSIETDPKSAMRIYADANIPDVDRRKKSVSMFDELMNNI